MLSVQEQHKLNGSIIRYPNLYHQWDITTYEGKNVERGGKVGGLFDNFRDVQGIFDDLNAEIGLLIWGIPIPQTWDVEKIFNGNAAQMAALMVNHYGIVFFYTNPYQVVDVLLLIHKISLRSISFARNTEIRKKTYLTRVTDILGYVAKYWMDGAYL